MYFVSALSVLLQGVLDTAVARQPGFHLPHHYATARLMRPSDGLTGARMASSRDGLQKPQSCGLPVAVAAHANGSLASAN